MNIVFDIGNVICEWNPQKLVSNVFAKKEDRDNALQNIIGHSDWLMLDKGTISLEKAIQRAAKRCNFELKKVAKLYEETPKSLVPFAESVALIRDLSNKGYNLYVLSNMHDYAFKYLTETYDFWDLFSGIVVSSHIKAIKPETEIFKYLLNEFKLHPQETLFLDDMPVNVNAALTLGIDALLVDDPYSMKELIKNKLR